MENLIEQGLEGQREAEVGAIVDELLNVRFSLQTINDLNDALTEYNVTSDITSFEDAVREANGKFGKHSYITHLILDYEEDGDADAFAEKVKGVIGEANEVKSIVQAMYDGIFSINEEVRNSPSRTYEERIRSIYNRYKDASKMELLNVINDLSGRINAIVIDNLKIKKEQYGKDPESTIVIPRPDSRRYTSIGEASHLSRYKESRPSEAKSRVYEDSRGGEGSQKETVDSRYSIPDPDPDPDPSESFYECKCNKCCSNLLNSTYILFLSVLVIRSCSRYRPLE